MGNKKRTDQFRDTTVRMTPDADNDASTIRGMAHLAGFPRCGTQSDAVILSLRYMASNILDIIHNGKSKKRP